MSKYTLKANPITATKYDKLGQDYTSFTNPTTFSTAYATKSTAHGGRNLQSQVPISKSVTNYKKLESKELSDNLHEARSRQLQNSKNDITSNIKFEKEEIFEKSYPPMKNDSYHEAPKQFETQKKYEHSGSKVEQKPNNVNQFQYFDQTYNNPSLLDAKSVLHSNLEVIKDKADFTNLPNSSKKSKTEDSKPSPGSDMLSRYSNQQKEDYSYEPSPDSKLGRKRGEESVDLDNLQSMLEKVVQNAAKSTQEDVKTIEIRLSSKMLEMKTSIRNEIIEDLKTLHIASNRNKTNDSDTHSIDKGSEKILNLLNDKVESIVQMLKPPKLQSDIHRELPNYFDKIDRKFEIVDRNLLNLKADSDKLLLSFQENSNISEHLSSTFQRNFLELKKQIDENSSSMNMKMNEAIENIKSMLSSVKNSMQNLELPHHNTKSPGDIDYSSKIINHINRNHEELPNYFDKIDKQFRMIDTKLLNLKEDSEKLLNFQANSDISEYLSLHNKMELKLDNFTSTFQSNFLDLKKKSDENSSSISDIYMKMNETMEKIKSDLSSMKNSMQNLELPHHNIKFDNLLSNSNKSIDFQKDEIKLDEKLNIRKDFEVEKPLRHNEIQKEKIVNQNSFKNDVLFEEKKEKADELPANLLMTPRSKNKIANEKKLIKIIRNGYLNDALYQSLKAALDTKYFVEECYQILDPEVLTIVPWSKLVTEKYHKNLLYVRVESVAGVSQYHKDRNLLSLRRKINEFQDEAIKLLFEMIEENLNPKIELKKRLFIFFDKDLSFSKDAILEPVKKLSHIEYKTFDLSSYLDLSKYPCDYALVILNQAGRYQTSYILLLEKFKLLFEENYQALVLRSKSCNIEHLNAKKYNVLNTIIYSEVSIGPGKYEFVLQDSDKREIPRVLNKFLKI